jgi:hypothetical protein
LYGEHLALLVGIPVVVAQQVQHAVGAQQLKLVVSAVASIARLPRSNAGAEDHVTEQSGLGLLVVVTPPGL